MPTPTFINVSPTFQEIIVGQTVQLTADVRDEHADPIPDAVVIWSSDNEALVTVDENGLVTGVAPGASATVTATCEAATPGSCFFDAILPACATVLCAPCALVAQVGDVKRIQARLFTGSGARIEDTRNAVWTSSDEAVATVVRRDNEGSADVTIVGNGTATITATCEGQHGTLALTVSALDESSVDTIAPTENGPESGLLFRFDPNKYADYDAFVTALEAGQDGLLPTATGQSGNLDSGQFAIVNGARALRQIAGQNDPYVAGIFSTTPTRVWIRSVRALPGAMDVDASEFGPMYSAQLVEPVDPEDGSYTGDGISSADSSQNERTETYYELRNQVRYYAYDTVRRPRAEIEAMVGAFCEMRQLVEATKVDGIVTAVRSRLYVPGIAGAVSDITANPAAFQSGSYANRHVLFGSMYFDATDAYFDSQDQLDGMARVEIYDADVNADPWVSSGGDDPPMVDAVVVEPSEVTVERRGTSQLEATVTDSEDNVLTDREVTWSSGSPSVASVNSEGLVTARNPGRSIITATCEEVEGTALVIVPEPTPSGFVMPPITSGGTPNVIHHKLRRGR